MKLSEIADELDLEFSCGADKGDTEVRGGYCCDLLSNVMAHCRSEYIWITVQTHQNILGVASLLDLAGVIIAEGFEPDPETLETAKEKEIPLLLSDISGFELSGRLYGMGLRSESEHG